MSPETLFVITLIVVSLLAGFVAKGMFDVGTMPDFEMSRMYFAASVLAFLAYVFMLAMIIYAFFPEAKSATPGEAPGKQIFDACVKVIPPVVTLIIGFYFGSSHDKTKPFAEKAGRVVQQQEPASK